MLLSLNNTADWTNSEDGDRCQSEEEPASRTGDVIVIVEMDSGKPLTGLV